MAAGTQGPTGMLTVALGDEPTAANRLSSTTEALAPEEGMRPEGIVSNETWLLTYLLSCSEL